MDIKNSIDSHLETKFSIIQNQFEQIEKRFLSFEERLSNPNINRPEPDFSEIEQKLNDQHELLGLIDEQINTQDLAVQNI